MLIHYLEFNFKFVRRLLKKKSFLLQFRGENWSEFARGKRNEENVNTHSK